MKKSIAILLLGLGIGGAIFFASQENNINSNLAERFRVILPKATQSNTSITETKTIYKEESNVVNVVRKANQSVVSIAIKREFRPFNRYNPFSFELLPQYKFENEDKETGIGTGFILTSDGIVLTNRHVVNAEAQYVVVTNTGEKYDVTQVTKDPFNDLALLKVNAKNLSPVDLGDSDALEVGQSVVAMGNALGEFNNTVTVGIVSGLGRNIKAGDGRGNQEALQGVIQTDAAINPGNSGGPLLNLGGQVVGINTAVADGSFAQNIGFAIPINKAKPIIDEYITTGKISRPYIGVSYRMLTRQLAVYYDVPEGAYIFDAIQGGPANIAGIQEGDIITEVNGEVINQTNDLAQAIRKLKVGDDIEIKYYREGNTNTIRLRVGQYSEP